MFGKRPDEPVRSRTSREVGPVLQARCFSLQEVRLSGSKQTGREPTHSSCGDSALWKAAVAFLTWIAVRSREPQTVSCRVSLVCIVCTPCRRAASTCRAPGIPCMLSGLTRMVRLVARLCHISTCKTFLIEIKILPIATWEG